MPRSLTILGIAVAALLPFASPAAAKVRRGPAGTAFYSAPSPLPGKKHGDAIWWRAQRGADALAAAGSNRLVLYRSEGVAGKIAVSGSIATPKGKPPKGGWPVVTWAHGTTGIADQCAPTRDGVLTAYIHPLLDSWLRRGYAVVRTDYEGLGTPADVHPFLDGRSEGRGVLDIVRTARQLDKRIGRTVIIAGHSQGGQAALFAASLAPGYTPDLRMRGTVAFAPVTHLSEQLPLTTALKDPNPSLAAYAMMITRGLDLAAPALHVTADLSDVAASRYGLIDERCSTGLREPDAFGDVPPADLFKPGADFAPVAAALDRLDDAENLKIREPVRIDQGTADTTVFPTFTEQTAKAYKARGINVTYQTYEGATHTSVTTAAAKSATAWIAQRLRG